MSKKSKVIIVGPTSPYRGGIAQYSDDLARAIGRLADVEVVSFKRLYPKWLYPGESDKEPAGGQPRHNNTQYIIDVYNPLSLSKSVRVVKKANPDFVVIAWWTLFWQPGLAFIVRRLRKQGVKTVYLCHNLVNHKTGGIMGLIDRFMYPVILWMLKQSDAYILQSSEQVKFMEALKPDADILQRIHPIYDRFPRSKNPKKPRGKLDLLFFGFIRPYKGLPVLMEALKGLDDQDIHLTIVGEPWIDKETLAAELKAVGVPNLELKLSYVDDDETADYFERADAVVLPYLSATGSGVVATAYHYGKPVIATSVGGLKDAVIEGKTGWLIEPGDSAALKKKIAAISRKDCAVMKPAIAAFCKENDWDAMAAAILNKFA